MTSQSEHERVAGPGQGGAGGAAPRPPRPSPRTAHERMAQAFEASGDGWYEVDLVAATCVFSPRADELLGLPTYGQPLSLAAWVARIHPEDRPAVEEARRAHQEGRAEHFDARFRLPHGCGWRWIRARGRVVERDGEGRPLRLAGVLRDVDEVHQRHHREVEAAAARHGRELAEAEWRTTAGLLRTMSDAVLITDPRFNVTRVAGATSALLGWSEQDLLGRNLLLDFALEFPDGDEAAHQARLESGRQSRVNVCFPVRGGGQRELDLSVGPLRGGDGRPTGYVLLGRDQGPLRLTEQSLREAEQRIQLVLRSSLTGYWEWDLCSGRLVNDQRFHTWPGAPASLSGDVEQICRQLAAPADAAQLSTRVKAVQAGQAQGFTLELSRPPSKGPQAWVQIAGMVLERDGEGRVRRICGTVTDVTERVQLEGRERRAERFASMATLVRGLAHEVNNPLATVVANLSWLSEVLHRLPAPVAGAWSGAGLEPLEELAGALRDATDGAARVKSIVADLKAFAADLPRPQAQASLEVALKKALRLAHHALEITAGVAVSCPRLPDLGLPEDELVQALAQVLVNAGQATGAGPNQVRVAADLLDVTRVQVTISDTGVGMDAATRAMACEPFFTTRAVGAGRGLGLSVCRGIVTAAGGSLELQSAPGQGTLVKLILPVHRPAR